MWAQRKPSSKQVGMWVSQKVRTCPERQSKSLSTDWCQSHGQDELCEGEGRLGRHQEAAQGRGGQRRNCAAGMRVRERKGSRSPWRSQGEVGTPSASSGMQSKEQRAAIRRMR